MIAPAPQLSRILEKVQQVELRALRALDTVRSGQLRSVFRGQGIEFDQMREYVPGDDIRYIDWSATARMARPYVKVHIEERDLCAIIALDVSPSSDFGTIGSTRREQQAELAAVLAFAAVRSNDRVGLLLFSDDVERYIPPAQGRAHALLILQAVLSHQPAGRATALAPALKHIERMMSRRAVVFLLSDFFTSEDDETLDHALRVLSLQHEVVALCVRDPLEQALPDVGVLTMEDSETGEIVELDTSDPVVRRRYEALSMQRQQELGERLRMADIDLLELSTAQDYTPQLAAFFKTRGRTMR